MEHGFHRVDILNKKGEIIDIKRRNEVNKETDIYHAIYTLLITPEKELALSIIPSREDLPNLYVNQYSATMSTIRRHNETAETAALRGISRELFIDESGPQLVGEGMEQLSNGQLAYISMFYFISEVPDSYSTIDIGRLELMSRRRFEALLEVKPERVSPPLRHLWEKYKDKLPV